MVKTNVGGGEVGDGDRESNARIVEFQERPVERWGVWNQEVEESLSGSAVSMSRQKKEGSK